MPKQKSFTFKYFYKTNTMAVTRYCQDLEPNEEVWDEIRETEFFDIKLCPYIPMDYYIPVLIKINTVTKPGGRIIHFSNELIDVFTEEHEKLLWKLLDYIKHSNYELQVEYKISTVVKDEFRMPTKFFRKVVAYVEKNNIPHLKLSVLDKDDSEHEFFRK